MWEVGHDAGFYARERWVSPGEGRDASESDAPNPYRPTKVIPEAAVEALRSGRDVSELWAKLLDGCEPVDEAAEITSSDINRQTAERWPAP